MGHIRKFIINFKCMLTWRSSRSNILLFARGNNLGVPNRSLKSINYIKQICFHFLSGRYISRADNRHVLELLREFLDSFYYNITCIYINRNRSQIFSAIQYPLKLFRKYIFTFAFRKMVTPNRICYFFFKIPFIWPWNRTEFPNMFSHSDHNTSPHLAIQGCI